ncbi:putative reverse transcriptase domain-containing protein [Tanacetum coccineum]
MISMMLRLVFPPRRASCGTEIDRIVDCLLDARNRAGPAELGDSYGVVDALSRKERVKLRLVRAMAMAIQYGVRGMILAAQSEAFKKENVSLVGSVMDEAHASRYLVHPGADKKYYNLRDMYWWPGMKRDIAIYTLEDKMRACVIDFGGSYHSSIRCAPFKALYGRKFRSPVLWAEIREGSLIGPELVLETTDKVVLIKEKLKAEIDRPKSYADKRCKLLEFEMGDQVLLKVSSWKGVVRFRKKGKLAPRYIGPFEIFERISLVAYSLHVPLDEIKVEKTLRFVKEPIEIMDHEIKSLKRSKISLVKVCWNSKCGPEFTWEREYYMKSKYPQLFINRADESAS